MNKQKAASIQQRLSSLRKRLRGVEQRAASNEWPYKDLGNVVPAYVEFQGKVIHQILLSTASEVLLTETLLDSPLTELHHARLSRHFAQSARQRNVRPEDIEESTFASCETSIRIASNTVAHLEGCIHGEQSIDGRVIYHGPLWSK